ncbi:MAG TPA: Hsp20/alpha crystallin family protein, partial [Flavisolibacter sp.]
SGSTFSLFFNGTWFDEQLKTSAMTVIRFKQKPLHAFNKSMDDFPATTASLYRNRSYHGSAQSVPVNISETEQAYILEVFAPGMQKDEFRISFDKNVLTVSGDKKPATTTFVRKEYTPESFSRSFTVDEHIDSDAIAAEYVNGVLTLNLPKKLEVKEAAKRITIQ